MFEAILIVIPIVLAACALLVFAVRRHLDAPSGPPHAGSEAAARGDVAGGMAIGETGQRESGSGDMGSGGGGDGGGGGD